MLEVELKLKVGNAGTTTTTKENYRNKKKKHETPRNNTDYKYINIVGAYTHHTTKVKPTLGTKVQLVFYCNCVFQM